MTNVYKTTIIETLKVKTHISFINMHFENLLQNLIVNMNVKRSINAIETTIKRIRKNLRSKKKQIKTAYNFIVNKKR